MEALLDGRPVARFRTTFAWMEGGGLLVQRADTMPSPDIDVPPEWIANSPMPIVSVFGLDDFTGRFSMLYTDGRGVHRIYEMSFEDGEWNIWGQAASDFFQRFSSSFNAAGDVISGRWERSSDGSTWALDFDQIYTRVG
jgi:hypothetical protein